jgi:hypothetical protein
VGHVLPLLALLVDRDWGTADTSLIAKQIPKKEGAEV